MDYSRYVGQYVKRFYTPFQQANIFKIKDFRNRKDPFPDGEFLYDDGIEEWWSDIEDSVIITNETPMIEDERVANVNHPEYKGYNPFK